MSFEPIVLEFRDFLEDARATLRAAAAQAVGREEVEIVKEREPLLAPAFHRFVRSLDQALPPDRIDGARDRLKELLADLFMPAPVYRQAFLKPFGYAGDFLTMHIVYGDHYQGDTAYARYVNRMLCDLTASRAAIAQLEYLRRWIFFATHARNNPCARILSVGCGPAREVRAYLGSAAYDRDVVITLLDQDFRALAFAQGELAPFTAPGRRVRIEAVRAAADQLVQNPSRFANLGGQDLIYAGGLLEYLSDDAAAALLRTLYRFLAPRGALVAGNLSPRCDSRAFLESVLDWHIACRTDEELLALGRGLPILPALERDASGLNGFLVAWRRPVA